MRIIIEEDDLKKIVEQFLEIEFGKDKQYEIFPRLDNDNNTIEIDCYVEQV